MSSTQMSLYRPVSSTGRTCQWILNHCKGGRAASTNIWWGRTLPELSVDYSRMRDPKGKGLGCESDGREQTAGVVQVDRLLDYSPHPALGPWAEKRQHFDAGVSITLEQSKAFGKFFASVREAKKKGRRSTRPDTGDVRLAADVLPPMIRKDV